MGIVSFLLRGLMRLGVSLLILAGALSLIGLFIFYDLNRVYPDQSHFLRNVNADASDTLYDLEYGLDCDRILADLNRYAELGAGNAWIAAAALDESGECGTISGSNAGSGLAINSDVWRSNGTADRFRRYINRAIYATGLMGDPLFWARRDALLPCRDIIGPIPNPVLFENNLWLADYREIRERKIQFHLECNHALYELGISYIDHANADIRAQAASLIRMASWRDHPEAVWWMVRVLPTLDYEGLGFIESGTGMRIPSDCAALEDEYGDQEVIRQLAAAGHPQATAEWIARGPLTDAEPYALCIYDNQTALESRLWRGGYDTPFWYAVTAFRSQSDLAIERVRSFEPALSADCVLLAQQIGAELHSLPERILDDLPDLRQMILATTECQPEGLRDESAYHSDASQGRVGYSPPELVRLPSYEPIFRRVEPE
ncbi:hypothetical protein [Hyphobacterium sp.]|uniref:hypothetical protein n=1 Tax=Hyphobacterium sp. TaxID=2004662 RepID=UPI003BAD273D